MAVVAMVEPEMAEKTVPAATAMTASRPGTCLISRSTPSITLSASPVWNRSSPIKMNSGIGVSEKFITATTLLRTTCSSPGSPPRNSMAPRILMATNDKATGMPRNSSTVEPPSSSSAAISHAKLIAPQFCQAPARKPKLPPREAQCPSWPAGACGTRIRWRPAGRQRAGSTTSTTRAARASSN